MRQMKYLLKHILLIVCIGMIPHTTQTIFLVNGNNPNAPFGFNQIINAKVYDERTGTIYLGLYGDGTETYALSKSGRPTFRTPQSFIPMISEDDSNLYNSSIEFLAISQPVDAIPVIGVVPFDGTPFNARNIYGIQTAGIESIIATDVNGITNLHDAGGNSTTAGIVNIVGSPCHFFALVRPESGAFGAPNSGVAMLDVRLTDSCMRSMVTNLEIKDAVTGMPGNRAVPLENNSTVLKGDAGGANITFATDPEDLNQTAMYYDRTLDRLYIGVRIGTGGGGTDDIAKDIVVGLSDCTICNSLALIPIVADSAITSAATNEVVVTRALAGQGLRAKNISVLHATTGPDYLIVNGAIRPTGGPTTATDLVGNLIYALPLVNNPEDPFIHGTLADKNSALVNGHFITPATAPGDLATENDVAAVVGGAPLPLPASINISDLQVSGDTVFVSTTTCASSESDTGIIYSQAQFDATGKIISWTPWTKHAVGMYGINIACSPSCPGPVRFFSVDQKIGSMWIVDGVYKKLAGMSQWSSDPSSNKLARRASRLLSSGSFSALDLDQSTRGFYNVTNTNYDTIHRYALFGGNHTVVFARTSVAATNTPPVPITTPQTVITDFSSQQNLIGTKLKGCVQALEYSRRLSSEGDSNYFFAGTEKGLYAFALPNGNGFNVTDLGVLTNMLFTTGSWQFAGFSDSSIIDITTSGRALYVLARQVSSDPIAPFTYAVYAVPFKTSLAMMFLSGDVRTIAQSGVDALADAYAFYGLEIISTGTDTFPFTSENNYKEQLMLATNQGLFYSNADQTGTNNGIIQATNQTDANWQLVTDTQETLFYQIAGTDAPTRHTVWPSTIESLCAKGTLDRSRILQISGNGDATTDTVIVDTFVPPFFNSDSLTKPFRSLDPITHFWTDGARRYFITTKLDSAPCKNNIMVLPFRSLEWNTPQPQVLSNPVLEQYNYFYWVRMIGATGLLMIGTDQGIVALE